MNLQAQLSAGPQHSVSAAASSSTAYQADGPGNAAWQRAQRLAREAEAREAR